MIRGPAAMSPVAAFLQAEIARRGPIPFRDFMEAALYHPEGGYYASGRAAIGRGGDYYTSVSVGPLFGRLLARQFVEMWERLGQPADFSIVEQGAHGGEFAGDALAGLREFAPECFASAIYVIVEPSAALEQRQRGRLSEFAGKVAWSRTLSGLEPFQGVHFSNELLDAFPVHRVRWDGAQWLERHVALEGERFVWIDTAPGTEALHTHLALLPRSLSAGYETEVNLAALDWIAALATRLARGWVLLVDYGYPRAEYYRPERQAGTLSAYAQHRRVDDPLDAPGKIDLTAHIDFTAVAERALAAGLGLRGFTDQHHFMVGLSRLHFTDTDGITPAQARELRAFKTLMHPNLLGQSFKVLCFEKAVAGPLAGFAFAREPCEALGI
jgi:SAM-dependent MidA family methyltransferase